MIKKLFLSILSINTIVFYFIFNFIYPKIEIEQTYINQVVDIKITNEIINKYSNLVLEMVPANE
jgi:hypothetical protein